MVNCIFNCDGVKCSSSHTFSFENIICSFHLKEIFGLIPYIYRSEPEKNSELCGPWLMPDIHFSFPPNTVIFPETAFLDEFLIPERNENGNINYLYKLNPRIQNFINALNMKKAHLKDQKTARYLIEMLRNLCIKNSEDVTLIDNSDYSHVDLKRTIQNRLNTTFMHIKGEPYYHLFDKIHIYTLADSNASSSNTDKIDLISFSPIYAFLLFNCLFDKHYLPVKLEGTSPLMAYGNLVYKKGIGFVTVNEIKNNNLIVVFGEVTGTNAYYQMKTSIEPKGVKENFITKLNFPDSQRNLNVISTNDRYCHYTF